ncbi:hypothetical protein A2631_02370 [Candidatus Daviesbacteria bacterium RIFCSPHIGHO2_01_FULL_44_29]|nr:MAG: hypothetical protein A2631_02370 [Candidatus Daviesbacteria bacterium RIFCSPHIGHO2_01_FULL_44_29]OGE40978.1 MAG: hypothetical protein A3E86_03585 [Candidatus Daviesbacteria bacterium RIFCSPHIGHO2_12_FULL_47_45]OGE69437.1 MAG: hypothetical protein A3B55_03505 [Candidatus Daviesbacteria bacterium RIFCSPLOWO2_01_FULL_43_15]
MPPQDSSGSGEDLSSSTPPLPVILDPSPMHHVPKEMVEKARDAQGRFDKDLQDEPDSKNTLPKVMSITEQKPGKKDSEVPDKLPPMFSFKIANPIIYLKHWWKTVIANEGIDLRFRVKPLTAIAIGVLTVSILTGTGFVITRFYFLPVVVPNAFLGKTTFTGTLAGSNDRLFLLTSTDQVYTIELPLNQTVAGLMDHKVLVKGKLDTRTAVLKATEIIDLSPSTKL